MFGRAESRERAPRLLPDLGHLAEKGGFDFFSEVRRGIEHRYAEHHALNGGNLGPDAAVEIIIRPIAPKQSSEKADQFYAKVNSIALQNFRLIICAPRYKDFRASG